MNLWRWKTKPPPSSKVRTLTFEEWQAHWGEARVTEIQEKARASGARRWDERLRHLWQYPCWELEPRTYWTEDWPMMMRLWKKAGGRCFDGTRLMAAKWDVVWERFGAAFPGGFGTPHPPYARSSCADWHQIDADESIVLGVISEQEWRDCHRPETDEQKREREAWVAKIPPKELADFLRERGSRAERYAKKKQERAASLVEMKRVYAEQNREREAVDQMFVRMGRMDEIFADKQPARPDPPVVLMTELQALMRTPVFDRYPNWKARAIRYAGVLLEEEGRLAEALEYYRSALDWNPALPLKRKIAALRKQARK